MSSINHSGVVTLGRVVVALRLQELGHAKEKGDTSVDRKAAIHRRGQLAARKHAKVRTQQALVHKPAQQKNMNKKVCRKRTRGGGENGVKTHRQPMFNAAEMSRFKNMPWNGQARFLQYNEPAIDLPFAPQGYMLGAPQPKQSSANDSSLSKNIL